MCVSRVSSQWIRVSSGYVVYSSSLSKSRGPEIVASEGREMEAEGVKKCPRRGTAGQSSREAPTSPHSLTSPLHICLSHSQEQLTPSKVPSMCLLPHLPHARHSIQSIACPRRTANDAINDMAAGAVMPVPGRYPLPSTSAYHSSRRFS